MLVHGSTSASIIQIRVAVHVNDGRNNDEHLVNSSEFPPAGRPSVAGAFIATTAGHGADGVRGGYERPFWDCQVTSVF